MSENYSYTNSVIELYSWNNIFDKAYKSFKKQLNILPQNKLQIISSKSNIVFELLSSLTLSKLFISLTSSDSIFFRFSPSILNLSLRFSMITDQNDNSDIESTLHIYENGSKISSNFGSIEYLFNIVRKLSNNYFRWYAISKNRWLNLCRSITEALYLTYPLRLVPLSQFSIISHQTLNNSHYLGKWVESSIPLIDEDGKLNPSAIDIKRIHGFSTNKIPKSKRRDLSIVFNEDFLNIYTNQWIEGTDGVIPLKNHFEIDKTRQYYFIQISKIDGYNGTYHNPPNKIDVSFNFRVEIVHKPLVANYWHFEFKVIAENEEIDTINSKAWRKAICSSIRTGFRK